MSLDKIRQILQNNKAFSLAKSLLKTEYVVNSVIYMSGSILSQAIAFFVLPLFTRYLSPSDYGILSYTSSITSIIFIFGTLALNSFVLRHYFELETEEQRKDLFGSVFVFLLGLNIIFLSLQFVSLPIVFNCLGVQVPFHPYFELALLDNFFEIFSILPLAYYRVSGKAWKYFWLTSLKSISSIAIGLILVIHFNMGVLGRLYAGVGTNICFLVIYLAILRKIAFFRIDCGMLRKGLVFSLPLIPSAFASVGFSTLDRLILERYVPLSDLGIYSVGVTLGSMLSIINRGFYLAIEPEVYSSFRSPNYKAHILKLKNGFLYFLLFAGCSIIVFSKEIVTIIVSQRFYDCYKIMPFCVVANIFRGAELLVGTTLFALNKTGYQLIIFLVALLVNGVSLLVLTPFLGIQGAAFASTLSFFSLFSTSIYFTKKFSPIKWGSIKDTLMIVLLSAISYMLMHLELSSWASNAAIKFIVFSLVSGLLFFFLAKRHQPILNPNV